jgi:hypothetical protein
MSVSIETIDYQARQHEVDFTLSPYYDSDSLSFKKAQKTLDLKYKKTLLYYGPNGQKTSGLDALSSKPADQLYKKVTAAQPALPLPNATYAHVSVDAEGLVLNSDGS